jgi:hypothetical protein
MMQPGAMIRLWDTARAKRAAVSTIAPLVEATRARLGGIPAAAWQDPYLLGFMSMLIALVAVHHTRRHVDSDSLGLIQLEAFARITGVRDDRVGEQICFLSALDDEAFLAGCRNAWLFLRAYNGEPGPAEPDAIEADLLDNLDLTIDAAPFGRGGVMAAAVWRRCFEGHLP